jgi:tyrosyl-tRNA synthetase
LEQVSDAGLAERLDAEPLTMYAGFDPTADSLHLGHLVPIMAMAHFQRHGHRVLAVVGGATGMVGDPSGKSEERNLLTPEAVEANAAAVKKQMACFLRFAGENPAQLLNNHDWIGAMTFVDWLREVGKFFTISYMLQKESVKKRLGSEVGISFTEFSYMTMQAYDFLHLYRAEGCSVQVGGNDQWGNITAGIDLVHKAEGAAVHGITFPLLQTSTGEKFGKTAGNAVWLDPQRTSPYQFYQYWVRTTDADVERFLKLFTFLPLEEIQTVCREHAEAPERRLGQKRLAAEATRLVHGEEGLAAAERASKALFGGELTGLSEADLLDIFADVPSAEMSADRLAEGVGILDLAAESGLAKSKGEARRAVQQGGLYLNNERVPDQERVVTAGDLLAGSVLVLRSGKKRYLLVRVG